MYTTMHIFINHVIRNKNFFKKPNPTAEPKPEHSRDNTAIPFTQNPGSL